MLSSRSVEQPFSALVNEHYGGFRNYLSNALSTRSLPEAGQVVLLLHRCMVCSSVPFRQRNGTQLSAPASRPTIVRASSFGNPKVFRYPTDYPTIPQTRLIARRPRSLRILPRVPVPQRKPSKPRATDTRRGPLRISTGRPYLLLNRHTRPRIAARAVRKPPQSAAPFAYSR